MKSIIKEPKEKRDVMEIIHAIREKDRTTGDLPGLSFSETFELTPERRKTYAGKRP